SSARAPRSRRRSRGTTSTLTAASLCGPASPGGGRSPGAATSPGRTPCGWTSSTSTTGPSPRTCCSWHAPRAPYWPPAERTERRTREGRCPCMGEVLSSHAGALRCSPCGASRRCRVLVAPGCCQADVLVRAAEQRSTQPEPEGGGQGRDGQALGCT